MNPLPLSPATSPANRTGCSTGETSPAACPRAAGDKPFRVFWADGRIILFRDDRGEVRPVHSIRILCLRHKLHRLISETRDTTLRTRLARVWAEADRAFADVKALQTVAS